MQTSRADVADLIYFLAIARQRSFSRAAVEIGVSASALSHALKGLESRLGVRLLNRTTKSVTLTAAGEALAQSIGDPFEAIDTALDTLNRFRDTPSGRVRINAAVEAANLYWLLLFRLSWIGIPMLSSISLPVIVWWI